MSILVETEEGITETNDDASVVATPEIDAKPTQEVDTGTVVPEKFAGKTAEEIAASYVELEAHVGSLRNQLGDYRIMVDRHLTLEEKRVSDLESGGAESFEIDATELLANPEEVFDKYYQHRIQSDPTVSALQERLDNLEGQVTATSLEQRHPDAAALANDPAFQQWVNTSPLRSRIANYAVQTRDTDAFSELLDEYKGSATQAPADVNRSAGEVEAARAVATESNSSGSSAAQSQGKRFSRHALIEMKRFQPEKYNAMADEILLAYKDGRIVD